MNYIYILNNSIIVNPDEPFILNDGHKHVKLRPQCHKLLLLLLECKQLNVVATYEMIGETLWSEDGGWGIDKKQSLKDCVRELNKTIKCIKNVRGKGYVLIARALKIQTLPVYSLAHASTRGWTEYAIENLELKENEINKQLEYISLTITNLLNSIENYTALISNKNDIETTIIGTLLFRMKITIDVLKDRIPSKQLYLKKMSDENKHIIAIYRKKKGKYDSAFDKRIRNAKHELDSLLSWCLEAKIELDRDRKILSEYELLKEEIVEN